MSEQAMRKRIWGWYAFDWASQPYNTLLLTFIFAPYIKDLLGDGSEAQAVWGYGVAAAGLIIAFMAPLLGSIADRAGASVRLKFIWVFSGLYIIGAWGLWFAAPDDFSLVGTLILFGIGLFGMEFATIFTNAMLPGLASREQVGRVSGTGWAIGYAGGLIALVLMLTLFAENDLGKTLIGIDPILGLDASAREGTRAVGPLTAIWFAVFMIPFVLWVRERPDPNAMPVREAVSHALPDLKDALATLPKRPSLFAFLASSMLYRDALNGLYFFGGIYTAGVLGWSVVQVGVFGILAVTAGAVFAWIGGRADARVGPMPVIITSILALVAVTLAAVFITKDSVLGIAVAEGSKAPDIAFYIVGAVIGAAGGTLQSSSRGMMVRQADPERMTQGFGLYALAGKASAFIAPFSVAVATDMTGSQQLGITPLLGLFLIGLILLFWVRADGDRPI